MSKKSNSKQENILKILSKNPKLYSAYHESEEKLTWCSGCGNFQIQNALQIAVTLEKIPQKDLLLCFDVGCNGNGSDKMPAYTIHGLHGRVISLAAGCAVANPNLKVIASAGDGATFSEGINHLIHGIRNDYPMVFLLHNNLNYGLTTGQPSATTKENVSMNSAPDGVYIPPLNPAELALSLNPSFYARTFSGDLKHLVKTLRQGLNHNGFAFIEIFQVCPTYNRFTPQNWYWDRIKPVEEIKNYDNSDIWAARKISADLEKELAIGLIYKRKESKNFLEQLPNRQNLKTAPVDEVKHFNIDKLLKEFT